MERREFLKFLGLAPAVALPVVTTPAPAPLVVAAEGIQASNLEAQQQQWSQTHGG